MIGLSDVTPTQCICCGAELPDEPHEGNDGSCLGCWEESQAKAKAQLETERAEQLRYLCWEWFTERSPLALERKSASYEEASYYADGPATLTERIREAS